MKEILFRGKRLDNGEWEYGAYSYHNSLNRGFIVNVGVDKYSPIAWTCEVIPETVGQFIGLTDKNGKKIFEGDIFEFDGERFVCRWDEGNIEFGASNKKESMGMAYFPRGEVEVIGNIHDNPELLEGRHV